MMARALVAAVVNQLFSYTVGKGIQYKYFETGDVTGRAVILALPADEGVMAIGDAVC